MKVKLVHTQGCYQNTIVAEVVRETKNFIFVSSESFMGEWKFSKEDIFRTGNYKNDFPKYMIKDK